MKGKSKNRILKQAIFCACLFFTVIGYSQKQSLEWIPLAWESGTISGKYIEKMYLYIPVKIEDLPYDFTMQLDLGVSQTQFYGNPIKPYMEEFSALADKLGPFENYPKALFRNVNLYMGPVDFTVDVWHRYDFGEKIPKDSLHTKTQKHIGTIASDIFQDKIVVIDYKSCRLAVADSLPAEYQNWPSVEFELNDGIIILPFRIDGKNRQLMFDTGSSPFPLATSKKKALEISDGVVIDSLSGPLWWGREITFYGLEINKSIELDGKDLKSGKVYYDKEGLWEEIYSSLNIWGLTGNAYFFDHTVIIDYKNKLFRIK